MQRYKYAEIIEYEERLKTLFTKCEISLNNQSRICQYFTYLRDLEVARTKNNQALYESLASDKARYYYSQYYSLEIKSIVDALEQTNQDINILKIKLVDLANGTYLLSEENPSDTSARNTTFELSLFAFFHNLGARVKLNEPNPDLRVSTSQFTYNIECKRPSSDNSVEKNIRNAWRQLRKPSVPDGISTIAISLDKVLINDDLIYHSVSELTALGGLDHLLYEYARKNQPMINKIINSDSCVVLYYISCLSGFENRNLPMAKATYMIGNVYNFKDKSIYKDLEKFSERSK